MATNRPLSIGEEIANSITHGFGFVGSIVAFPVLVAAAAQRHDWLQVTGCVVFATTLLVLYATSTLYHALPPSRAKRFFRVMDHIAIYLLIAGSYTPFMLGVLRGTWGWTILVLIWTLAVVGTTIKAKFQLGYPRLTLLLYLLMGWLVVVAARPMITHVPTVVLIWLIVGGLCYTGGVVFYLWERLRYGHAIWHLFVLAGSVSHVVSVWYVLN